MFFGLGLQYDDGIDPAVAINGAGTALEVHRSQGGAALWCHVGTLRQATVDWSGSVHYDGGATPACALNDAGVAIEVHSSQWNSGLWCHVGRVQGQSVRWGGSIHYDDGITPSVALSGSGQAVEVHQSQGNAGLWYHVGTVAGDRVDWSGSRSYDSGTTPRVAMNNRGVVVEVHRSQWNAGLWYHVGRLRGGEVAWGPSRQYDEGLNPSVALTDAGMVIETHRSQGGGTLWCRVGTVSGDSIQWTGAAAYFDDGSVPCVAANGRWAIQVHQSENFTTLWYSTARIMDRARWMADNLSALGGRALGRLVLPAAHDAGMYSGSGLQILGKTQDLDMFGQLSAGVRYFDLRPKWQDNTLYVAHGPITGPRLSEILDGVARFMADGGRELVILKYSHYDGFSDQAYQALIDQTAAAVGRWLYPALPPGRRLADLTLSELAGRVLVVCDGDYPLSQRRAGFWTYRDWSAGDPQSGDLRVYDQYANTMDYDTMRRDQLAKFAAYTGRCEKDPGVPCDLFLLSWTLTPPTAVWQWAQTADRNLGAAAAAIPVPNAAGQIVNLLYVDYVEYARVADVALCMNLPGA